MRDHNENFQESDHREHPNFPQWGGDYLEDDEVCPCGPDVGGRTLACGSSSDAP
jgi:hypothetical protein